MAAPELEPGLTIVTMRLGLPMGLLARLPVGLLLRLFTALLVGVLGLPAAEVEPDLVVVAVRLGLLWRLLAVLLEPEFALFERETEIFV